MSRTTTAPRAGADQGVRARLQQLMDSPTATYYLLLSVTTLLVAIGLVMVLSASMIVSIRESGGSPYAVFITQAIFAVLGAIAMVAAMRIPLARWKRLGGLALVVTLVLQALVFTALGSGSGGNRNWLDFKVFSLQPSELGKIAVVLFGARVLAHKRHLMGSFKEAVVPFVFPAAAMLIFLVMLGHDLGTTMVLAAIVAGMLFAAGMPLRWFAVAGVSGLALLAAATLTSINRLGRINIWLHPGLCVPKNEELYYDICRQPLHARYALADGGLTGIGLGASKEKWQWLSAPHNDFIFAIIGEEIGLIGTLVVLVLFAVFAYAAYRLVIRSEDFFVRVAAAGVMTWIVVQAIINIGAVIGTLPIIGVPLPFVSSGGSSLVTTMVGAGLLLAFARAEPRCAEQLSANPASVRGSQAVLSLVRRRRGRG
ncbi:MAG: putative lipid II flippase FtsW [Tetrasphaera sp.]